MLLRMNLLDQLLVVAEQTHLVLLPLFDDLVNVKHAERSSNLLYGLEPFLIAHSF